MGDTQEAIGRVRNAIEGDGRLVGTDVAVLLAENERLRSGLDAAVANSTILISRMRMHGASTGKDDHLYGVCWPRHQEAFDALNERAEGTGAE